MNNQIIFLIFFTISNVFTLKIEDFKKFSSTELSKIKLRSSFDEKLVEEPEKELEELEKLSKAVEWFGEIKELEDLSRETLKWIEDEKLEIKTFQKLKEEVIEKGSVEDYVKGLAETIEGFLPKSTKLDQNQVLSIKKWILVCKFIKNEICTALDVEGLKNDQRTAIKILTNPRNGELLMKLSSKAKVQVWPINLNISKLVGKLRTVFYINLLANKEKKLNLIKAKFHESVLITKAGKAMKQVLDEILSSLLQDNTLKEEIDMRAKFMENFLKPEKMTFMTFLKLSLKKDAFIKLIDTLIAKIEQENHVKESDLMIIKQWLFFNQMILADDWVTRSGKFVKPWPKGFTITGYDIPDIVDDRGYFRKLPKIVKDDIISGDGANLYFKKSWKLKFLSMIGRMGKKKTSETGETENKGIMSKAMDKVKESASNAYQKLTNLIPERFRKNRSDNEEKSKENKGFMSRIFGSKQEGTPAEGIVMSKPEENKGLFGGLFTSSKSSTPTPAATQAQAASTKTGEQVIGGKVEEKKGMLSWFSKKLSGNSSAPVDTNTVTSADTNTSNSPADTNTSTTLSTADTNSSTTLSTADTNTSKIMSTADTNTSTTTSPADTNIVSSTSTSTTKDQPEKKGFFSSLFSSSNPAKTAPSAVSEEKPKRKGWLW